MKLSRRDFLRSSTAAVLAPAMSMETFAQPALRPPSSGWDTGALRHVLPTVSDTRILLKASFNTPLSDAPRLRVGELTVEGQMTDTQGEHWSFFASDLAPNRPYRLSLIGAGSRLLSEPWDLATFPNPDERPREFRVLFFACAGGHEAMKFLPPGVRNLLLRRALSFRPDVPCSRQSCRCDATALGGELMRERGTTCDLHHSAGLSSPMP